MRSGFTHVRICLDCNQKIDEGNNCGCPVVKNPFVKGAQVTICADQACSVPTSLQEIGRVGNGQYRIKGTATWYSFDGQCTTGETSYCRLRESGDETAILKAKKRLAILAQIKNLKLSASTALDKVKAIESNLKQALVSAGRFEAAAKAIDPSSSGEVARKKAEDAAKQQIDDYMREADLHKNFATAQAAKIELARKNLDIYQAQIDSLTLSLKD